MRPEDIELSRRYADILRTRGNSARTLDNYLLYAVKSSAEFLGERGLGSASAGDIVAYQIEISASGRSDSCVRVATYALRGFLEHVLERVDAKLAKLPRPRPATAWLDWRTALASPTLSLFSWIRPGLFPEAA